MARPLYYDGSNLREMSDTQLERLVYYTQVAYANQLNSAGNGSIFIGASGGTSIGSHVDTRSTQQINTRAAPSNDGITQTYPAYPGIGTESVTTYNYRQYSTVPAFPSTTTLNSHSYLCLTGNNIEVANTEAKIYAEIISTALNEIKQGNEVGSYRVVIGASAPTNGGAGTWTDKGTWFVDKRYTDVGNITYKLFLKRNLNTIPGSNVYPVKLYTNGNIQSHSSITNTSDLVSNVLLPCLTRRLTTSTDLCYEVSTNSAGSRGAVNNTRYNQASNDRYSTGSGMQQIYYSRSTPNTGGSTTIVTTRYLRYLG